MPKWSPDQYLKFEGERTRPSADLLVRVPLSAPGRVLDVGCGPGNSTELLVSRFPDAAIAGVDSSPEMIETARTRLPGVDFAVADLSSWRPETPFDLIFGNAVFQWLPKHLDVIAGLFETCRPGGVIAFQVPDNQDEPTHRMMQKVAADGAWRAKFTDPVRRERMLKPAVYYDRLRPLAAAIDIWHTVYYHVLPDPNSIVEWVRGSGLRVFLDRLDEDERQGYVAEYAARIAESYPPLIDGRVMLRFPRLFVVAVRA